MPANCRMRAGWLLEDAPASPIASHRLPLCRDLLCRATIAARKGMRQDHFDVTGVDRILPKSRRRDAPSRDCCYGSTSGVIMCKCVRLAIILDLNSASML